MAQGIKALRRIQMGLETTQGTAVAATTYWRGTGTIQSNPEVVFPEEDIGILTGVDRSYIPRTEALLTLDETPATFEQLPYLFEMGIRHADPSSDADSAGVWSYAFPVPSSDAITSTDLSTYTIEGGDNAAAEEFAFAHARSITLSGEAGGALMMGAEIVGRQVGTSSFTESLSIPDVTEILFSKGSLYINAVGEVIGTTQVENEFISMSLSITTGWTPVYTADGNIYFSFIKQVKPEVVMSVTFEHNTKAIAEKAAWIAETPRQIRVQFDGATGDQLILDMAGKWDNFEKLGERDGNDIVTGNFRARYNSTADLFFEAVVHSATLDALP